MRLKRGAIIKSATFICGLAISLSSSIQGHSENAVLPPTSYQRSAAFKILKAKCNVCHSKRNKKKVFTKDNMDGFAPLINTQVFIKKRMPKGKQITLSRAEYQTLQNWIQSLK